MVKPSGSSGHHDIEDPEKDFRSLDTTRPSSITSTIHGEDVESVVKEKAQPQPVKVATSQRRGLLSRFTIIAEVHEPKHYPRRTKWFLTFIVAVAGIAAPVGSAILFPALGEIRRDFNTSATVTNLSVALYMLALAIFPLWWSSFSETLGRRSIYVVSFSLFVLWNILTSMSTNITMLIVTRVLAGGAAGSVQAVGAGTIADIWEPRERGRAMSIFYLGPLMGPMLGPIVGGAVDVEWGWRSNGWFMVIYGVVTLLLLTFFLPETLKEQKPFAVEATHEPALDRTTSRPSVQGQTKGWMRWLRRTFYDPLTIVQYLRFPAVAISIYYASITFACLYILNISVQAAFSAPPYNFSPIQVGCTYLAPSTGYVLASLIGGRWTDSIMVREAKRAGRYDANKNLIYLPEDRMRENVWLAAIMFPLALVAYGWIIQNQMFWVVPLVANFFFGFGSMMIFSVTTTMLTEFLSKKSSSGVALNNLVRNICSCIGGIVAQPILSAIRPGWTFTVLSIVTMCSSVVIWAMRQYGPRWRKTMDEQMK